MLTRFYRFLFGDVPVEIPSSFPLNESVERLKGATRNIFFVLFAQVVVGRVTPKSVRLVRSIPFVGNSFKPIFVGQFVEVDGRVVLRGRFTMFQFSKIFMSIWLGFLFLWTCATAAFVLLSFAGVTQVPSDQQFAYFFPFAGAGMIVVGILFVRFCWWLSSSDMTYLSNRIVNAIQLSRHDH